MHAIQLMKMRLKYIRSCDELLSQELWHYFRNNAHAAMSTQASSTVKPFSAMPGLSSLPLVGPLHHFLPIIGEIGPKAQVFEKIGNFRAKHGPIMKMKGVFSKANYVFLFEPDHFEQVFRDEDAKDTYPIRPGFEVLRYYREVLKKSTLNGVYGLTASQGLHWKQFRTKVNPVLLKRNNIKIYARGLDNIAEEIVSRIAKLNGQKDFQWEFELEIKKWALESVALIGLGTRLGCLKDDLKIDDPASQLMQCVEDIIELTYQLEIMPSPWRYISTPNYRRIIEVFELQWKISYKFLQESQHNIKKRGHDIPEADKSIIEKLLAIDEKVAFMMATEMLLAGIDTITFATCNLLYHLATNPKAQDILRQEIRAKEKENSPYLRACLKEALRIYHVVPINMRRTTKEHVVGGYHIPKGVDIVAPNQYLSSLDQYYPRAKEFLPERWLVDKNDPLYYGNTHPMVSLPFGFGTRSCIGRRIAELEIDIFVKRLLDTFKITWEGPPANLESKFSNHFKKLDFKFHPAK